MVISGTFFEFIYLFAVAIIWSMLIYQVILTFAGYLYSRRKPGGSGNDADLPFVSIMVPARNEEKVILETVKHIFNFDYPENRLEVIILNDGSTDSTKEILESINDKRLKLINIPLAESGKGKSRVLNLGIKHTRGEIIAVYDADNRPERNSLRLLIRELLGDGKFVGAIGKFRTINKDRTFLTRFINIESVSFQWIIQAGRSFLFDIAFLPGTNFVIWKKAVLAAGGWDENALTEDAELSIRLYRAGGKIKFVPQAVTWEQEPENLKVWVRQRERWVRGNNYVLKKLFSNFSDFKSKLIGSELIFFSVMYYVFFSAMVLSDIFFILGLFNVVNIQIQGPFLEIWIVAYMLFVSEIVLMLSRESNEDSLKNIFFVILMYFTYCQLWLWIVFSALVKDFIRKEKITWYKTERTSV